MGLIEIEMLSSAIGTQFASQLSWTVRWACSLRSVSGGVVKGLSAKGSWSFPIDLSSDLIFIMEH